MDLIISWSARAEKDIEGIHNYYGPRAGYRITSKLIREIISVISALGNNPYMGPKEERLSHRKKGFRYLVKRNYKIIYWVNEMENRIEIASIFDCRQDPGKMNFIREPAPKSYSK